MKCEQSDCEKEAENQTLSERLLECQESNGQKYVENQELREDNARKLEALRLFAIKKRAVRAPHPEENITDCLYCQGVWQSDLPEEHKMIGGKPCPVELPK